MIQPKASIIILDFKKSRRVSENVESIEKQETDFPFEIIVVDNSVNPGNAGALKKLERKYTNVQVLINEKNLGYIRGNNQGAALARGEYLLIVNPDIVWRNSHTLRKLISFMDKHPTVGILGPKQVNDTDGSVAMTVRAFPRLILQISRRTFLRKLPFLRGRVAFDEMQHLNYNEVQNVDWLQSSFWVIRKELWDSLGGLNNDYFIFMSDPDLCFKVWEKGYEVKYFPDVTVYADGIRASEGGFITFFRKWTLRQHLKDAIVYSKNHWFKGNPRTSVKR